MQDIHDTRTAIGISCGLSLIYALVYIYLMSFFAEVIAWICVVLVQLGLWGSCVGCYFYRASLKEAAE